MTISGYRKMSSKMRISLVEEEIENLNKVIQKLYSELRALRDFLGVETISGPIVRKKGGKAE